MKHFTTLSKLEDSIYDIDKVRAHLRLLSNSVGENLVGTVSEDIQIVVADLDDRLSESLGKMKDTFYQLWEDVREDSFLTDDDQEEDEEAEKRWDQVVDGVMSWNSTDTITITGAAAQPVDTDLTDLSYPDDGIIANPRGEDQQGTVA